MPKVHLLAARVLTRPVGAVSFVLLADRFRSLGSFTFTVGKVVSRESQFARWAADHRNVGHTRRVTAVLQKRRDGTDLSRSDDVVPPNQQKCSRHVRRRDSHGPTKLCARVSSSYESDRGSATKCVNNRLRDTRFLHGHPGKITASSGFGRDARTKHALNNTASSATKQRVKLTRREVLSVVECSNGPAGWVQVARANGAQSPTAPDVWVGPTQANGAGQWQRREPCRLRECLT